MAGENTASTAPKITQSAFQKLERVNHTVSLKSKLPRSRETRLSLYKLTYITCKKFRMILISDKKEGPKKNRPNF